jgi:hypothetical protein
MVLPALLAAPEKTTLAGPNARGAHSRSRFAFMAGQAMRLSFVQ